MYSRDKDSNKWMYSFGYVCGKDKSESKKKFGGPKKLEEEKRDLNSHERSKQSGKLLVQITGNQNEKD